MAAAAVCDQENGKRQGTTNNQRVATASKDGQDKEKGAHVFRQIRPRSDVHSTKEQFFMMTDKSDPYIDECVSSNSSWYHEPYQMHAIL